MKRCPTCNRTFTDDALSYCLHDGSPLSVEGGSGPPSYDPGATVQYNPAASQSTPPPAQYAQPQHSSQQAQQPSWSPGPPAGGTQGQPPPKKSKALFWVLGIVGVVVVLGIGGIVLALVLVGMSSNSNNDNVSNSNNTSNRSNSNNSTANEGEANSNAAPGKTYVAKDDFTTTNWWVGTNTFGKSEYVNGQYQLTGASLNGYVSVYGPKNYLTKDATTRLTARSVTGMPHPMGYGIAVFGELKNGLLDDYAFVVRTYENPAYRIVMHDSGKETTLVDWTAASQIRTGTSSNQLEVRASADTLDFYINGQLAKSIAYSGKNSSGIVGVYTSGVSTTAFDDLEVYK